MTSGGLLIYMSTLQPGTGGSSILAGSEVGFTTADADRTDLPALPLIGAGPTITYRHGLLKSDATTSQTADLSMGKGFLAQAFDGNYDILDADGLIAVDIADAHVNPIGWDIWIGYIPANGSIYDVVKLSQLQSVDLQVADGAIHVVAKSPAYLGNEPLYGIRTSTQLDTDPVDVTNPTDPTYLKTSIVSQFGGMAFGDSPASLKCGQALPVETLSYYCQTREQSGDVSTRANPPAYLASKTGINVNDTFNIFPSHTEQVTNPNGTLSYGGSMTFWCRCPSVIPATVDETEAIRLIAAMNNFISNGYSIVLSDGNWFLDLSTYTPWTGTLALSSEIPLPEITINTLGKAFGKWSFYVGSTAGQPEYSCVWFNLQDQNGKPLFPRGIDGTQVQIYAVPKSVCISNGQYLLEGLARNQRTVRISGQTSFDGQLSVLKPGMASSSDFVTSSPITGIPLTFDGATPGVHVGAFEVNIPVGTGWSGTAVGSLSDIVIDPSIGWNGGSEPVSMTLNDSLVPGGSLADFATRLHISLGILAIDADFFSAETSHIATATDSTGRFNQPFGLFLQGAFEKDYNETAFTNGPTYSVTVQNVADRNRTTPNWYSIFNDITSFNAEKAPALIPWNLNNLELNYTWKIREIFIWAFYKIGFSSIYATVYPFWTQASCAVLATDGAGNVLAGGQGTSPIAADGSQNWTPLTLPNPIAGGIINITGSAYGAGVWVSVGSDTPTGGSPTSAAWVYTGGAWQAGAFGAGGAKPTRVRFLGTHFVCCFSDGTIRSSTDGIAWSAPISTGLSVCYDVAFDGANYIAFGDIGKIAKSTNLTSWATATASAITGFVYGAAWLASGAGGAVYIAVGANGKAYYASQANALAGTWTAVTLDVAGSSIDAVAVTTSGSNAIVTGQTPTGFKIWSTGDGASYGLMFQDATDSMGGTQGYGSSVVYTPNGWVVGTQEGNIITSTYGGQPAGSTWIPWGTQTPNQALANLRGRYFGGTRRNIYNGIIQTWNPVQWTGGKYYINLQSWGIAFDPPTDTTNDYSGTNADAAARKIAEEWWAFSGEMPAMTLDGSHDNVEQNFPELALGNIEDVATIIIVQYNLFGGQYLSSAYIQNVNVAYPSGKPDAFFFAGWDSTGNTKGLALWTFCRNVFLKTGILRSTSLTYDSVQDADTLGVLWTTVDPDLGERIRWLCDRPRYLKQVISGNDSAAAQAQCGARYKPNTAMLDGRQMPALNSTGYGIIVQADHNYTQGTHTLDIAFPPA
jgi:hypothetical protein